jgi:pyrimidine-specific ribonucleoside hydrolase
MRRIFLLISALMVAWAAFSQPLPVKRNHSVIIDTDCAIDDFRAISILLSRPEISVKAILLTDGSLSPAEGAQKVSSLLNEFDSGKIPVAYGNNLKGVNPLWRKFNSQISWGRTVAENTSIKAIDCLSESLRASSEKIVMVCLGPLTNVADLIRKEPSLLNKIERIIWYNDSVKPLKGFNYECDIASADLVLKSGVRIDIISALDYDNVLFDLSFAETCSRSQTRLGKVLNYVFSQQVVLEKLKQNHFRLYDDLVALYLTNPELFGVTVETQMKNVRYNTDYNSDGVKEAFTDMISGKYVSESNVVFNRFPAERGMFNYDVRQIIDTAIARYGINEWKANVMTDEFHGHLGVFSIVGAKMGIRAREFFGVGPDMLEAISYAGSKPPYSCLTDGIQVSTGATLGMGTIQLAPDSPVQPSALFKYKGRTIRITLKKEYLDRVDADINEGIVKFGLMDDGYWKLIRRNALKYWVEWDRNVIFDIEAIDK